jgi:hypothetical protein
VDGDRSGDVESGEKDGAPSIGGFGVAKNHCHSTAAGRRRHCSTAAGMETHTEHDLMGGREAWRSHPNSARHTDALELRPLTPPIRSVERGRHHATRTLFYRPRRTRAGPRHRGSRSRSHKPRVGWAAHSDSRRVVRSWHPSPIDRSVQGSRQVHG